MRTSARRGILATLVAVATATLTLFGTTPAQAALPTPIAASTARSYLASMPATTEHSRTGYSRDLFPHWITISGSCDTRETVLKRDGSGVVTDSSCAATSGSWHSPYDGATWTAASDVDIDHLIPLAEAWDTGRLQLDHLQAPAAGQRPHPPPAPRRDRQRQPVQKATRTPAPGGPPALPTSAPTPARGSR